MGDCSRRLEAGAGEKESSENIGGAGNQNGSDCREESDGGRAGHEIRAAALLPPMAPNASTTREAGSTGSSDSGDGRGGNGSNGVVLREVIGEIPAEWTSATQDGSLPSVTKVLITMKPLVVFGEEAAAAADTRMGEPMTPEHRSPVNPLDETKGKNGAPWSLRK